MSIIPVTKPYIPNRKRLFAYLARALDSKWLTNNGPLHSELEDRLCEYLGVENLLLVANATCGLSLALRSLNIEKKVITTPFSWVASAGAPLWDGYEIQFSDIDCKTYNLDVSLVENLLSRGDDYGAILPVHVFGNPCNLIDFDELSAKFEVPLIYDAAHSFGAKFNSESVLNYGDASVLSFPATKTFNTVEGGCVVFKDNNVYLDAKDKINFGLRNGEFLSPGFNFKMSEFHAAMGLACLDEIVEIEDRKKEIFLTYESSLRDYYDFQKIDDGVDWNYAYCSILFTSEEKLLHSIDDLSKNNILARRYFYPSLNNVGYFNSSGSFSNSEFVSERILCLPSYVGLKDKEVKSIIEILKNAS